jgi:hypothetical protein
MWCSDNNLTHVFNIDDNYDVYSITKDQSPSFSNVAIAAAITSYARIYKDKFKR